MGPFQDDGKGAMCDELPLFPARSGERLDLGECIYTILGSEVRRGEGTRAVVQIVSLVLAIVGARLETQYDRLAGGNENSKYLECSYGKHCEWQRREVEIA